MDYLSISQAKVWFLHNGFVRFSDSFDRTPVSLLTYRKSRLGDFIVQILLDYTFFHYFCPC